MSVSILEALRCAEINIENGKRLPPILDMAKEQLHNAIVLLEKGYPVDAQVEDLLDGHDSVEDVPQAA